MNEIISIKNYLVKGKYKTVKGNHIQFKKDIRATTAENAVRAVIEIVGSKQKVKQRMFKITEVVELTDHSAIKDRVMQQLAKDNSEIRILKK